MACLCPWQVLAEGKTDFEEILDASLRVESGGQDADHSALVRLNIQESQVTFCNFPPVSLQPPMPAGKIFKIREVIEVLHFHFKMSHPWLAVTIIRFHSYS